jgi:hypothetical protein
LFGQTIFNLAFCCYLHHQFFNLASVPGGRFSNSPTSQSPIVVRNPKTKFRSPLNSKTFKAKTLTTHRTLQHICKAHKTHRTKANLAKELQLPTHGNHPSIRQLFFYSF